MTSLHEQNNSYEEKILHLQTILTLCQYHCTITEIELAFSMVLFRIQVKFTLAKKCAFDRIKHALQTRWLRQKQKVALNIKKMDQIFTRKHLLFKQQVFRIIFLQNQRARTKKKQKNIRKQQTLVAQQATKYQLKRLKLKYAKMVTALDSLNNQLQRLL